MGIIVESKMNALFNGLTSPETEADQLSCENEMPADQPPMPQKKLKTGKKTVKEAFLARFNKENLDKTRLIAFNNGLPISDVIDYALGDFIERYEKKYGRIKTKGRKVNIYELL